jgi:gluconokinase
LESLLDKVILGIDIGTTNIKLIAVNQQGKIVFESKIKLSVERIEADAFEQKPELILEAVVRLLKQIALRPDLQIEGLSFSCAMHSLILLDQEYQPLSNAILWSDNRAKYQVRQLKANSDHANAIYRRTGTPIHPMSPYAKLLWLRQEKSDLFAKASYIVGIKDYLFQQLFDELVTDCSLASASGLFNIKKFDWDLDLLNELQLSTANLPKIVSMTYQLPKRSRLFSSIFITQQSFPCIAGGGDGMLSNVGVGAVNTETLAFTIGTSGAMRVISNQPILDQNAVLFCYALDKARWLIGGASNNGGNILAWLCQKYEPQLSVSELLMQVAEKLNSPPDLLFYPYLHGERAPLMNAQLTAQYVKINPQHQKLDFLTAAVLGMAFNFRLLFEKIKQSNHSIRTVRFTGGVSQSKILQQLFADLLNLPIEVLETEESSALGAIQIAIESLGSQDEYSLDSIYQNVTTILPHNQRVMILEKAYQDFIAHLPLLVESS